ncbi:MAG: hypothetical protein U9P80_08280, partial [Thermodesulfobacteriota bacterium]|nr:hypothetical protein [Thermodesulfobacteriota bacterium]
MKRNTMVKLVFLVVFAMLLSPAIGNAFGKKGFSDDARDDPSFQTRIPLFIVQQYDTDADGQLSDEERETAHAAILEQHDIDGDGKLSWTERRSVRDAAHEAFIAKYDTDGDS